MRVFLYRFLLLIFIGTFSQSVFAEIYKCKGANGKIIYSESPCKGMTSERMDILDNAIDSSTLRREIENPHHIVTQGYSSDTQQITTTAIQNVPMMSDKDKQNRIRDNIVVYRSDAASDEKKEDAQNEITALNNKASVNELSYEDNLMRRNLKVDLNNADQTKRRNALYKLSVIYSKY